MRFSIIIFLVGASFVETVDILDTILELSSNTADLACRAVRNTVQRYPINRPFIEKVTFQLRMPCIRIDIPVSQANRLSQLPQFDVNKNTVFFVAGWFAPPDYYLVDVIAKAYNCRGDSNFVLINTGGFISNLYVNAAYHTGKLGEFIAIGLRNLGLPPEKMHFIGHSLGAHILGNAARYYYNITGEKFSRITALDPARPCFASPAVFPRLRRGDADFIDIIHTNPGELGMEELIGDVDFFPAGLRGFKPGCGLSLRCSHEISVQYFAETVYPGNELNFVGFQCENYENLRRGWCVGQRSIMGFANAGISRGIHYVPVRRRSPFGANANTDDSFRTGACGRCVE